MKIYQLKPYNDKQKEEMKKLDDKNRRRIENLLGRKMENYQWEIYKNLMIKRKN